MLLNSLSDPLPVKWVILFRVHRTERVVFLSSDRRVCFYNHGTRFSKSTLHLTGWTLTVMLVELAVRLNAKNSVPMECVRYCTAKLLPVRVAICQQSRENDANVDTYEYLRAICSSIFSFFSRAMNHSE